MVFYLISCVIDYLRCVGLRFSLSKLRGIWYCLFPCPFIYIRDVCEGTTVTQWLPKLRRLNIVLLLSTVALVIIGTFFVRSACSIRASESLQNLYLDHIRFAVLGGVGSLVVALWDYRKWVKLAPWAYLGVLVLLALVLIPGIGTEIMGARRWLFGIQPSEPTKIVIVVILAYLLGCYRDRFLGFWGVVKLGGLVGLPMLLILAEPDLGTALVLVPTFFAMCFAANTFPRILITGVVLGSLVIGAELTLITLANRPGTTPEVAARYIKYTGLKPHQIRRVEVFLDPDKDIYDSGYNARQAEIAVGSGGFSGKGYLKGDQNLLGYLPASVSVNDFIFSVLAEESGFIGAAILILLFVFGIFMPTLIVGIRAYDDVGKLLCIGITVLMFFHIFINIGMTVRIVPITGLPLPFISYGGTFMLTMILAVGIVQSVAIHGRIRKHVFEA